MSDISDQNRDPEGSPLRLLDEWRRVELTEQERDLDMSKYDDYVRTVDAQQAELQDRYNEQRRAARSDEPEQFAAQVQPALSDEDAQILELVRLARECKGQKMHMYLDIAISDEDLSVRMNGRGNGVSLDTAITELRSRLQPPQRPTKAEADRLIDRLGIYLRGAIDKGDGFAIPLKIDVDDYLKRNKENGGEDAKPD